MGAVLEAMGLYMLFEMNKRNKGTPKAFSQRIKIRKIDGTRD